MPSPAVTSTTVSGSARNNFSGRLGFQFTVGGDDIDVSSLGRWVTAGNTGTHTVDILSSDGSTVVATASVDTNGASSGQYEYQSITPVTLTASTTYFIVSTESNGGDQWQDFPNTVTPDSAITIPDAAYGSGAGAVGVAFNGSDKAYIPVNFLFDISGGGATANPWYYYQQAG
jgi:hypothetical protein